MRTTYRLYCDIEVDWLDVIKERLDQRIAYLEAQLEILHDIRDIINHPRFNKPLIANVSVRRA